MGALKFYCDSCREQVEHTHDYDGASYIHYRCARCNNEKEIPYG